MTLSASTTDELLVEQHGHIAVMTLNRPERLNAMSLEMLDDLYELFAQLKEDTVTRVLIITGAGEGFCSVVC